ncbi:hypothetical protein AQ490_07005 [Wenjunlia vitaminophila]|uniref:ABC-2 type transport system permease protein n=1 Tax=Wenjunlia vitaminophila TaxID=76728 RepID=A0A0T6LMU8_WENVI|nr:ABC transporter permease [Wenjunlia vitaminophila]KRV47437.1 hypothetical protein AQ490_07005 [Wenjunlia vitaminophila]
MNATVARLTLRGVLGRRRTALLVILPVLLVVIAAAVQAMTDVEDRTIRDVLAGFAVGTVVPLVGVIAGTGTIGPEIDDGSIVYLLSKPVSRFKIILTKLLVAASVTLTFAAVPTFIAGLVLAGADGQVAVAYGLAAVVASIAYSSIFLLLGVVTRHAVVVGLVYALVWEGLFCGLIEGARTLSVLQWSLSLAERIAGDDVVDASVALPVAGVLLVVVTCAATWFAGHRLRSFTLAGEN